MRPSVPRAVAGLLLAALAVTACTGEAPGIDDLPLDLPTNAEPTPTDQVTETPPGDPTADPDPIDGGASPDGGDPSPTADSTTAPPSTPQGPGEPDLTPADDTASVGANARALLRRDRPSLVLEIDVQQGVDVDDDAVTHLVGVLNQVLDKPGGIVLEGGNTFADTRTTWTAADLREAAAEHRSTSTTDDRVSVHVLYVAGSHAEDGEQTNAIGLAYSASTVALFPQRWEGVTSLVGSNRAIERAVLVHELGHLLALVNLGYQSDIDHEDPDRPGHSNSRDSVMYHAVESTLIGQVFDGPPPDTFDQADRSDLEGLRTGRL